MTTKAHKLLTGTDLHEPKGVETAIAGQVYVADGLGSGSWVTINTSITVSTGDLKPTLKNVADGGWVLMNDGSIGDASSGGSARANADTQSLYILIWTNIPDAWAPVVGGRGVSAAADFAAHKRMALPRMLGRALASAGTGITGGLTDRVLGSWLGAETVTLVAGNIPTLTSINASQSISVSLPSGSLAYSSNGDLTSYSAAGAGAFVSKYSPSNSWLLATGMSGVNSISVTYTNASPSGVATIQPSTFVNFMVKL